MRKIILLIALAITSYGYAQNDVTFQVDMSDYTGDFTTVELNGSFNSWCGSCNPMVDQGNGIWAVTLPLAAGPIEFKYTFDNWGGQEDLTEGSSCTVTNDGFTNRFLDITGDTIMPVVCWESCDACVVVPPGVTFQVDMSEYIGDFTTVELNGSFNGWCGTCNPMTDQGDGIWTVTLPLENGPIEFKYTFDNWTGQEALTEGSSCTVTNDGNTNRFLDITGDILLPVVCWESCQACGYLEQIDLPIDWEGDLTDYTVTDFGENSSTRVADPVNGQNMVLQSDRSATAPTWAGTTLSTPNGLANPIPFDVDNNIITVKVYSPVSGVIVRLKAEDHTDPTKSVETEALTTVADEWETLTFDFSNEANGTAAINYTYTYDMLSIFYHFGVDGATAGAEIYYCDDVVFEEGIATTSDVTFQVDMSDYTGDFTTVELNGTFNGWCGPCNPMTDQGNGIWAVTLPLENGPIEFKYTFDNWTGQEALTEGSSCTVTTDGNTNRFLEITADTIMPVVCWESCDACDVVPSEVTFQVDMSDYSGDFTTVELNGTFNGWCGPCNPMTDQGNGIWTVTLPLENGPIEFKYTFDNWTGQEALTEGSSCTVTTDGNTNRFLDITEDILLPVVCWESCQACGYLEQIDLPIDWEGDLTDYTVTDFGENSSTRVADPVNGQNMVLQSDRSATAPTWAGTTLSTPNGLANPIPFDVDNNIITVKVYSPVSGVIVRLKAEDHTDPTKSVETEALTTVADEWETLTFDFSNEANGTAVINYTYTYDMLSIFYHFGVDGATAGAETYYCDDVVFGDGVATTSDVTFQVDMSDYTGDFTTIELNGTFNGWCGTCNPMTDLGDGIWAVTLPLENGPIEFKYTFDNWTGQEDLAPGSACTVTIDGNTNRFLEITADTIMPVVCWESCAACTGMPSSVDVTFQVNMSEYTEPFGMVNLNGTFNDWCGSCAVMTDDDADNVYELTVNISTADTAEFKYTLDGWTVDEQLTEGSSCTITKDGFTNRYIVPTTDTILQVVCWESCDDCEGVGIKENNWMQNFLLTPNPSDGNFKIQGELVSNTNYIISVTDLQGKVIYESSHANKILNQSININNIENGLYLVNISSDLGMITKKILIFK